jgi:hypothetical protein
MWHSAQYRGDELIVLGHNPRSNDCMLVKLSGLPLNEQADLRRIATSRAAQESTHLIPLLRRMPAPDGNDWFSYLAQKMQQRNSPVFTLPIKEIQESLDEDQKAIFKGYGKGRRNTSLDRDDLARSQSGEFIDLDEPVKPINKNDTDYKLDLLMETFTDGQRRMQDLLSQVLVALTGETAKPKRVAKPRRARDKPVSSCSEHHAETEELLYEAP